jgi:group II intron reverse transcriptase/maturase
MGLKTPEKIGKLQRTLYAKAKEEPERRFHQLYDKVWREDFLEFAYRKCKANGGAAGVDRESFEDIEAYGGGKWLGELAAELKSKSYRPAAVRRVWIDKAKGGRRPLGVPTIKDRVVQTAAMLVIEPILEADLQPEQHGYRPRRSAQDAVKAVHGLINRGHREVVDADLIGYFDSIPRKELMQSVARRICDRQMLKLIKMWLKTAVVDNSRKDKDEPKGGGKRGTPQGSPISPLLANLYFRRFILGWRKLGPKQCQARIVSYADDFVICCKCEAGRALQATREILGRLGLQLNETKTCVRRLPEESLDFLGYTLGICHRARSGVPYLGTRPSKKSMGKICREIHRETRSWSGLRSPEQEVARLNRMLVGWANYFCLGGVSKAYRAVDAHTRWRLRQWLRRKHKKQGSKGTRQFPDQFLYERLGLVRLTERTRDLPWAKA